MYFAEKSLNSDFSVSSSRVIFSIADINVSEVGGEKNYCDPLYLLPRQRVNCNNAYRSVIDHTPVVIGPSK